MKNFYLAHSCRRNSSFYKNVYESMKLNLSIELITNMNKSQYIYYEINDNIVLDPVLPNKHPVFYHLYLYKYVILLGSF